MSPAPTRPWRRSRSRFDGGRPRRCRPGPDQRGHDRAGHGEDQGLPEAVPDLLNDRATAPERDAEIAPRQLTDVVGELDRDRSIEAELAPESTDCGLVHIEPGHEPHRIAGHEPHEDEHRDKDAEHDRTEEKKPPDQVAAHGGLPLVATRARAYSIQASLAITAPIDIG
jgi:hypothetical protein